jgi:hypothetical protein
MNSFISAYPKTFSCTTCGHKTKKNTLSTVKNIMCEYCNYTAYEENAFFKPTNINIARTTSSFKPKKESPDYKTKMYFYKENDFKKSKNKYYDNMYDFDEAYDDDYSDLKKFNDQLYNELFPNNKFKKGKRGKSTLDRVYNNNCEDDSDIPKSTGNHFFIPNDNYSGSTWKHKRAPFGGVSPFQGRVLPHEFTKEIFDPAFEEFGTRFDDFFIDNYSSNFQSNMLEAQNILNDMLSRLNSMSIVEKKKPTSESVLQKLKSFKLTDKYCKKNEKKQLELPNCCVCIMDIAKGKDTIMLPCGHMFHSDCIKKWLETKCSCPMCRFDLETGKKK